MYAPLARIVLRYGSGALVAWGLLSQGQASLIADDPDLAMLLEIGLGAAVAVLTELWYAHARQSGGQT